MLLDVKPWQTSKSIWEWSSKEFQQPKLQAYVLAHKNSDVYMPITAIYQVIYENVHIIKDAVAELMSNELKSETSGHNHR